MLSALYWIESRDESTARRFSSKAATDFITERKAALNYLLSPPSRCRLFRMAWLCTWKSLRGLRARQTINLTVEFDNRLRQVLNGDREPIEGFQFCLVHSRILPC